jgi:hypothetical protein
MNQLILYPILFYLLSFLHSIAASDRLFARSTARLPHLAARGFSQSADGVIALACGADADCSMVGLVALPLDAELHWTVEVLATSGVTSSSSSAGTSTRTAGQTIGKSDNHSGGAGYFSLFGVTSSDNACDADCTPARGTFGWQSDGATRRAGACLRGSTHAAAGTVSSSASHSNGRGGHDRSNASASSPVGGMGSPQAKHIGTTACQWPGIAVGDHLTFRWQPAATLDSHADSADDVDAVLSVHHPRAQQNFSLRVGAGDDSAWHLLVYFFSADERVRVRAATPAERGLF